MFLDDGPEDRPEDTVDTTMLFPDEDTMNTTVLPSSPFSLPNEQEDSTKQSTGLDEEEKNIKKRFQEALNRLDPIACNVQAIVDQMTSTDLKELKMKGASVSIMDLYSLTDREYLTDQVIQLFTEASLESLADEGETMACLTPATTQYISLFQDAQCPVRAEVQTLFLPIYKNRHWILAVSAKNTGMLELYDSLDNDDLFRGQPDYAFREERNAILGSEVIQCFKDLERNNNDWFRGTSWKLTLQESQRQADTYNCGLFLIRSIAHRVNGEYPASIEDPLVERMNMVKGIAKEIGAPLAPSPSPPPTPPPRPSSSSLSSSSGLPPPQPSSRRVHPFMPTNKLGALPFKDDEELEEGLTSSRVVFKWTNGYSYDLQPLMEADESELADAWDEGVYSNTKFKALSAPGTKLIQQETYQEWFPVGWQEFHDQYIAIEDKLSAR